MQRAGRFLPSGLPVCCSRKGSWSHKRSQSEHPADLLVTGWDRDRPAAMDIIVTSPLTPVILGESCQVVGAVAENRKMQTNSPKCQELGWACAPLAVESYGNWGEEHSLGLHPTLPSASPALVVADIYGRLNLHLVKSVARALLAR